MKIVYTLKDFFAEFSNTASDITNARDQVNDWTVNTAHRGLADQIWLIME